MQASTWRDVSLLPSFTKSLFHPVRFTSMSIHCHLSHWHRSTRLSDWSRQSYLQQLVIFLSGFRPTVVHSFHRACYDLIGTLIQYITLSIAYPLARISQVSPTRWWFIDSVKSIEWSLLYSSAIFLSSATAAETWFLSWAHWKVFPLFEQLIDDKKN